MNESSLKIDVEGYIALAAPLVGLDLNVGQKAGAARFLEIALGMARIVGAAPVDADSFDLAPVFRPGHERDRR